MAEQCEGLLDALIVRLCSSAKQRSAEDDRSISTEAANQLFDSLIYSAKAAYSHKFDPLILPDTKVNFLVPLCGKNVYGQIETVAGQVDGLSHLCRTSNSFVGPIAETGELAAAANVGVGSIAFSTKFSFNFGKARKAGCLLASVAHTEVEVKAILRAGSLKPELEEFQIIDLTGLGVEVSNFGLFEASVNGVTTLCIRHFSKRIRSFLSAKLRVAVNEALVAK